MVWEKKTNVPQSGGKDESKADPAVFRYSVNATDHARFLLFLNSPVCGRKRIYHERIRRFIQSDKIDKAAVDYYTPDNFYAQFRAIAQL